jgi:transposase-like protein
VDRQGQTIDFLLTEHQDAEAALRFLTHAIRRHGVPETITIDGSEANAAAIAATTKRTAPRSKFARSNISTTWWNRTIAG